MALATGSRLGPFEITEQIGVGGMGEVYRARDLTLRSHGACVDPADEPGEFQIYVRPFSSTAGGARLISRDGGTRPLGSRNGRELFYVAPDGAIMSVAMTDGSPGVPVRLIDGRYFAGDAIGFSGAVGRTYDVSPDGQRFLMIKPTFDTARLVVVMNWLEELRQRVPAP